MNPEYFQLDVDAKSDLIDQRLAEFLRRGEAVDNLYDATLYALGLDCDDRILRGKRVRPVLCLQTCEALGGLVERAMPFACAIELMHNFCLVHDDLEDGDRVRRDRPSVWVQYGVPHAINIGDHLLSKVFVLLTDEANGLDPDLRLSQMRLVSETLDHTHVGQALDINARDRRDFTMADYLRIAQEKTGYYLSAPILGGAMAAEASEGVLAAIRRFGHYIGPLFQVVDDLIDLTEGKGRGEIGSDIREGKRSYLVAATLEWATPAERERLFDVLDRPRDETTPEDIEHVIALFQRYGALDAARQYAAGLHRAAVDTLRGVPPPLAELLEVAFESLARRTR
ncbi:MAG: polyprenyl synthetase family protein [Candidatus Sumerlaeota bacterium]|nr:polyprenyl synthetase family protein [Candidatus Sumerlaeota bacterium]